MISKNELVIYQSSDGAIRIDATLVNDSIWLSLNQISALFKRDKSVINRHINNIFKERELDRSATVAKFATVHSEGNRVVEREIEFFNLDIIISVG